MAKLPSTDENGVLMQITPVGVSLARTVNASLSSSVEITLNTSTTFVRIYAVDQDVYLRWGIEDANASLFDEIIPANQIVDLAIPRQANGTLFTAFNVVERVSGATVIIIEK